MTNPSHGKFPHKFHNGPACRELPRSVDEIDLDRLVWDPAYRRAVRPMIEAEDDGDDTAPE